MFAAAIPQPAHNLPGGTLATSIRDALTVSSFRAHMGGAAVLGRTGDENPSPLWGTLSARTPPEARGLCCVDAREVHQQAAPDMTLCEFLSVCLPLAGVEAAAPWRELRDGQRGSISAAKAGPIWLSLRELDRVLPQIPGHEAKRFRLKLRRGGWKPSGGATG